MKFSLLSIIAFLTVELVATHDALPAEIYWKSMIPNTPMPELLKDILHPTGGAPAAALQGFSGNADRFIEIVIPIARIRYFIGSRFNYQKQDKRGWSANMTQLLYKSNETFFFLEKDLKADHKMKLRFMQYTSIINHSSFMSRQVVKSIPFSSSKMDEILNKFGVKRGSVSAQLMKNTIDICEEPGIKGEDRYCATSLESMVDFVTLKLGGSVKALSMRVMNQTKEEVEEYKIMHGVKKVGETQVVCHMLKYVYAVFLCHDIKNTVAYTVPLEGADGRRIKALCVCHRDTSNWNPKHLSFQLLKVKPGTNVPICHFLSQGAVMWLPKQK